MRDAHPPSLDAGPSPDSAAGRLEGRSTASYVLLLVPLVLLTEVVALELSLVYPALPLMAAEYRTPAIGWTLTVVSLVGVVAQPLLGKVADAIGKRRMIVLAAAAFAVGSLVCALAPSYPVLLLGRALQGTCMVIGPAAYGLIRDLFPPRIVPVAMGAITTGLGFSAVTGPLIGGLLVNAFGFRAVFWFCLAYVLVLTPVLAFTVPESGVRLRRRVDAVGGVLFGAGAAGLLLAVGQGGAWGWTSARTLTVLGCACALLVLFVLCELRRAEPLIDVRLLTGPALRWTLLAAFGGAFAIGGQAFVVPLLVQTPRLPGYGLGMGALGVALFLVPQGLVGAVCGPLGGVLARRRGPRTGLLVALTAFTVSAGSLAVLHAEPWQVLIAAVAQGIGFGFFFVSVSNLVVEAVPPTHTAVSTGMMGVASNLGNATGVTVLGAVLAQHILRAYPETGRIVHTESGFVLAHLLAAAAAGAALLVAALMRHGRTPATGGAGAPGGPREQQISASPSQPH
ncbi:MFS transporter [Streptomyces sp. NPDC058297]|uniref:MFS transporter n=1 Tax=Streptomyces sp. NPDC058297 TaxID=3346433 RepID=UPI0036E593FE